jgi:hypothetical protein
VASAGVVARVRQLLARAAEGSLDPAEVSAHASDLEELRARVARLRLLGAELELSPEVEALLAQVSPSEVAA